jgi:hypothetical protein
MATPKTMREPGDETLPNVKRDCGNCGQRRAVEDIAAPSTCSCEHCGAISAYFCHACGQRSPSTTSHDDGRRLCSTCRLESVRLIASKPTDFCATQGCNATVAKHIGEVRLLCERMVMRTA